MDTSPVAQSRFSLLPDPLVADSLAQVATNVDVLAAFASPDSSPDVVPTLGQLLHPGSTPPPAAAPAAFGSASAYAPSPDGLLPVAAILFDGFA